MKLHSMVALTAAGALALGGQAHAADIHAGVTSSAGLGCGLYGARVGFNVEGVGLYGLVQSCGPAASLGLHLQYEFFRQTNLRAYGFLEGATRASGNSIGAGVGVRSRMVGAPLDLFAEVGVARVQSSFLGFRPEPRLTLGLMYRLSVPTSLLTGEGFIIDFSQGNSGLGFLCTPVENDDPADLEGLASAAVSAALSDAAASYGALFSNIEYSFGVGGTTVSGNTARVSGTINLAGTNRFTGEALAGSFSGFVTLAKTACGWTVTGYQQTGE